MLLEKGANLLHKDNQEKPPALICKAVRIKDHNLVDELLILGADSNYCDSKDTPLSLTLWNKDTEMMIKLIEAGANPFVRLYDYMTIFTYIRNQYPEIFKKIASKISIQEDPVSYLIEAHNHNPRDLIITLRDLRHSSAELFASLDQKKIANCLNENSIAEGLKISNLDLIIQNNDSYLIDLAFSFSPSTTEKNLNKIEEVSANIIPQQSQELTNIAPQVLTQPQSDPSSFLKENQITLVNNNYKYFSQPSCYIYKLDGVSIVGEQLELDYI